MGLAVYSLKGSASMSTTTEQFAECSLPGKPNFIASHDGCFRDDSRTRYTGALSSNVWTSLSVGTPCNQHSTKLNLHSQTWPPMSYGSC